MFWRTQPRMWVATVGLCVLCSSVAHALDDATPSLSGEVLVLLASQKEGTIDPALSRLRALKHPPFNSFKSMKILSRSAVKLTLSDPIEVDLPNGRKLRLRLIERLPDGRAKVQVSINRPNQKDYLPRLQVIASAGEPFFVAGQKFNGGTLVIGLRMGERPKRDR